MHVRSFPSKFERSAAAPPAVLPKPVKLVESAKFPTAVLLLPVMATRGVGTEQHGVDTPRIQLYILRFHPERRITRLLSVETEGHADGSFKWLGLVVEEYA